ncbi:MAG TPA: ABC transporter permease [Candidatus Binatia bacterium]
MLQSLRLAWHQIRPQLRQLAVAVVVIALSVALASSMLLANHALSESFERSLDALAGKADLQITAASGGSFDESMIDLVRDVPSIGTAAPLLVGSAFVRGEGRAGVRVIGVDMLDDPSVRLYDFRGRSSVGIEDPLVFLSQPDSAIVPRAFFERQELRLGDRLQLQTSGGARDVVVRGLLADTGVGRAFAGQMVVMDLEFAQRLLDEEGKITQIDVALDADADLDAVEAALKARVPSFLDVHRLDERKADVRRAVAGFQLVMNAVAACALLLALVITSNRLATVYEARTWEMGVMRALGTSPRVLLRDLLVEALLLSSLGVVIGIPLGWLLAQVIVAPVADAMALNFKQVIDAPWVPLRLGPAATAAIAGLGAGVVAGMLPAWRVTRTSIVEVLRKGRLRAPRAERRAKVIARWLAPAAALACLALQLATGDGRLGALVIVSFAVAGALLIQPGLRAIDRPLHALLGGAVAIGVHDQSIVPSRAVAAGGVLLGGIAAVVWMGNTSRSFETFVVDELMATRSGDLVVDSAYNESAVGAGETKLAADVMARIAEVPGVAAVGAITYDLVERSGVGILAVDAARMQDARFGTWRIEQPIADDALRRVADGEAVFGTAQLLTSQKLRVGDPVSIVTPTGTLERPLAGVVNASFLAQNGDVVMSRALYERWWRRTGVNEVQVVLADDAASESVAREIRARLGDAYQLRVRSTEQVANWFADSVRQGFAVNDVMILITLVVVLFGSGDALAANVAERAKEIGTLRALGLSSGSITGMVLGQALAIGLVGAALGVAAGWAMSFGFVEGVVRLALGWNVVFDPTYTTALVAALLGIAACLLGAAVPAVRAGRMSAATLLRYE